MIYYFALNCNNTFHKICKSVQDSAVNQLTGYRSHDLTPQISIDAPIVPNAAHWSFYDPFISKNSTRSNYPVATQLSIIME